MALFFKKNKRKESLKEDVTNLWTLIKTSGNKRFISDIYNEKTITPHEEMTECRRLYDTNGLVVSAVQTMRDFIIGDEIGVETEDNATKRFFDKFFIDSNFKHSLKIAIENMIITGNGYIELDNPASPTKFYPIMRSEFIWLDMDTKGNLIRYIQEIPGSQLGLKVKHFNIKYVYGTKRAVKGIEIPADKLIHLPYGLSRVEGYGRSPLASVISDGKILREIERALALVARYKAINKKILSFEDASDSKILAIQRYFSNLEDFENPIINEKVELADLTPQQVNLQSLTSYVDYLKRKITSALAPEFVIHGDAPNYATAQAQQRAFIIRINSIREMIEPTLTKILRRIAIKHKLDPLIKFKFGEFNFELREEKTKRILDMYNSGLITLNEARKELGLEQVEGADVFSWETKPSTNEEA